MKALRIAALAILAILLVIPCSACCGEGRDAVVLRISWDSGLLYPGAPLFMCVSVTSRSKKAVILPRMGELSKGVSLYLQEVHESGHLWFPNPDDIRLEHFGEKNYAGQKPCVMDSLKLEYMEDGVVKFSADDYLYMRKHDQL